MELARHEESLGVDAIATIPPIYFRLAWVLSCQILNDISAAAPNTATTWFTTPQLAGAALTPSLTLRCWRILVLSVLRTLLCQFKISKPLSAWGEDHIVFNGPGWTVPRRTKPHGCQSWLVVLTVLCQNPFLWKLQSMLIAEKRFGNSACRIAICYQRNHRQAHFCTWKYVRCD